MFNFQNKGRTGNDISQVLIETKNRVEQNRRMTTASVSNASAAAIANSSKGRCSLRRESAIGALCGRLPPPVQDLGTQRSCNACISNTGRTGTLCRIFNNPTAANGHRPTLGPCMRPDTAPGVTLSCYPNVISR